MWQQAMNNSHTYVSSWCYYHQSYYCLGQPTDVRTESGQSDTPGCLAPTMSRSVSNGRSPEWRPPRAPLPSAVTPARGTSTHMACLVDSTCRVYLHASTILLDTATERAGGRRILASNMRFLRCFLDWIGSTQRYWRTWGRHTTTSRCTRRSIGDCRTSSC